MHRNEKLDRAIIAYRANPCRETELAMRAAQEGHTAEFYAEVAGTYLDQTREDEKND